MLQSIDEILEIKEWFHGTSAIDFDRPSYPFYVTNNRDKAERFSLRGRGEGERRILTIELVKKPTDILYYFSEAVLEKAFGKRVPDLEDSARYRYIAENLARLQYNGFIEPDTYGERGHNFCILSPGIVAIKSVEILD